MVFTPLSFLLSFLILQPVFYSKQVWCLQNLVQAMTMTAMLLMLMFEQRTGKDRYYFAVLYVLIVALIWVLLNQIQALRRRVLLIRTRQVDSSPRGMLWLWALETYFFLPTSSCSSSSLQSEAQDEELRNSMINLQTMLRNHRAECGLKDCVCQDGKVTKLLAVRMEGGGNNSHKYGRDCEKIKLALVESCVHRLCNADFIAHENDMIGLLLIFHWLRTKKNSLSCAFLLQKYHQCATCNLTQCFQY